MLTVHHEITPEGYVICRPAGELESFTIAVFRQALADMASAGVLIIDLSGVPFVDSAGLGALIGGIRRTRELGGRVEVVCGRPTLVRLLHTTGFDRIVTVSDTIDEAVTALHQEEVGGSVAAHRQGAVG